MLTSNRTRNMDKPMNVEQVVKLASESFFDPDFSMQNWCRTAQLMLKQANIYEHEGNDQMAYFLLYRYAHLIIDDLANHPHARDSEYRQAWTEARKAVKTCLAKLELLKPKVNKRYERYEERRKAAVEAGEARRSSKDILVEDLRRVSIDSDGSMSAVRLDAQEHHNMAVELANREMSRRAQRGQGGVQLESNHNTSTSLQDIRRQIDMASQSRRPPDLTTTPSNSLAYTYPHVPDQSKSTRQSGAPRPNDSSLAFQPSTDQYRAPPSLPPKPQTHHPPVPTKIAYTHPPTPPSPTTITPPRQFSTISTLESGTPLRTIFLPTPLRHTFTRLASPNTARNLETCGMLCGTLLQNAFFITRLVIPDQTATSDTCEMVNEAALYEYIDGQAAGNEMNELMVLGWIHTHPTQTCFLSSRDLHTHVWYQLQLAESIAIVCAPSKSPEYGIFRITDPPGMPALRACKQTGIFHPHAETHLYTDALGRPGHVIEHRDLQFEVVDLRRPSK